MPRKLKVTVDTNVCVGNVTYKAVADDLGLEFVDPVKAIN